MKNLLPRVGSALIALVVLVTTVYFWRESGIFFLIYLVVMRGSFEMARMFFGKAAPLFVRWTLVVLATLIFSVIAQEQFRSLMGMMMVISFVALTSIGILYHKNFESIEHVISFISKNCLGLVYTCFLPCTVAWMVQTNNGMEWFLCLLVVVFAGDIGAFIFGVNFGKTKIAPTLSPNKSLQGALGGLFFSTLAACVFSLFLPNAPFLIFPIVGVLGGLLGQIGDFFESALKRVSGVKDSGTIMPGHGGILDRLDGVLLAAPLFYFAAIHYSL